MNAGAWMMVLALVIALGSPLLVVFALVRSISNERTAGRSVWREFGPGLSLEASLRGGVVAYASEVKHGLLGVRPGRSSARRPPSTWPAAPPG